MILSFLRKAKRTKYDAPAPIVKPITVNVRAIWDSKQTVSKDLSAMLYKNLLSEQRR